MLTFLCIASYDKGHEFLRELKRQGCRVLLLTSLSLKDTAKWPLESIDEIFYMPDEQHVWNREHAILAVSHLARRESIDRLAPLDDLDLELAAALREHLRVGGMGETTTRYFRDKLAMRAKARETGLLVPEFVHLLNDESVREFTCQVSAPWVLKPRSLAGSIGIHKVDHVEELAGLDAALGDRRSFYLLEQFIAGDVFHVDSIVYEREMRFATASRYGRPLMEISHHGGVFTSQLLDRDSEDYRELLALNEQALGVMGMLRGVSHTEFIKSRENGCFYFLETSARVGGAHIVELVEAATGVNLWAEWAKLEIAAGHAPYRPPEPRGDYAGLLVSLARQEHPDTSAFDDPEIAWRMDKRHHVGFIVRSPSLERVGQLMDIYLGRIQRDFFTYAPALEKPGD
jgi:biotin carboxylase